jgi:hypothetical protein
MMERIEYITIDKSTWGEGAWQSEPDKVQWQDEATGYPCLIVRGPSGALCGYVGISSQHPYFECDYGDCDVDVHGGLTFANKCSHGDECDSICHKVSAGENDNVWWLGFDCAHSGDVCPEHNNRSQNAVYRSRAYVTAEVESLAKQLAAMATP